MTEKSKIALQLTQSKGICEMLIALVPLHDLERNYLELLNQDSVTDVRKAINKLPKYRLQQLIEMTDKITDKYIMAYRDEYPNGSRPSFTLYSASKFIGQNISIDELAQGVKCYLNDIEIQEQELLERGYDSPGIKKIVLVDTEKKSASVELYELNLRFARRHDYEDENGEPQIIYEAAYCFV